MLVDAAPPVTTNYLLVVILLLFVSAVITRFLPFCLKTFFERSQVLRQVGYILPSIIMCLLIFHSLDEVVWLEYPYGVLEMVTLLISAAIYVWRRNILLTLIPGMAIYLVAVNLYS